MAGTFAHGAFEYNRFENSLPSDALMDAYRAIYEEKCEDDGDDKKKSIFGKEKDEEKKDKKKDSKSDDKDDDSDDEKKDDKKDGKKLPPWLKDKKEVKEAVIAFLMNNGMANNEVSANVIAEHLDDSWVEYMANDVSFNNT
jgi:hypothetical protein